MLTQLWRRGRRVYGWLVATLFVHACMIAGAAAQAAGDTPDESRSTAFQAVEGAVKEDIAGGPLLLATYAIIWLVLFAYVFRLVGLQKRTQIELDGLRQELRAQEAKSGE